MVKGETHKDKLNSENLTILECKTCKFFKETGSYQGMSECHRNPPAFTSFDKKTDAFPRVSEHNFCGEYKSKELITPTRVYVPTRVYILAKEMGIKSSAIVKKCQSECLDVKNHMSVLSAGLVAAIREWFSKAD